MGVAANVANSQAGGLPEVELVNLAELVQQVGGGSEQPWYLYDCSIPLKLPNLCERLSVPRYFAHDHLARTRGMHAFSRSWPALFVAGPGTHSSLHVDQWKGHFWMAQLSGSKLWRVAHPDDLPLLAPDWSRGTLDPAFPSLDEMTAKPKRFPLLRHARVAEIELHAGDLIFVPGELRT